MPPTSFYEDVLIEIRNHNLDKIKYILETYTPIDKYKQCLTQIFKYVCKNYHHITTNMTDDDGELYVENVIELLFGHGCELPNTQRFIIYIYTKERIIKLLFRKFISKFGNNDYEFVLCSCNGNYTIARYLLKNGIVTQDGLNDALIDASSNGHYIIVDFLLANGAHVNCNDGDPLYSCADSDYHDVLKLLIERGADVNANKCAALKQAVINNSLNCVKVLLESDAKLSTKILQYAIVDKNPKMTMLLLQYININKHDKDRIIAECQMWTPIKEYIIGRHAIN